MGVKVTYDETAFEIQVTQAPDGNDRIELDVAVDLYSDGKEDWLADSGLARYVFPWRVTGAEDLGGSKQDTPKFFLRSPWRILPYDANHTLVFAGALYAETDDPTRELVMSRAGRTILSSLERPQDAFDVGGGDPADVWKVATTTSFGSGSMGEWVLKRLAKVLDLIKFG